MFGIMSGLHSWGDCIYVTVSVSLIMLMGNFWDYDVLDSFTKVCASGYQDLFGIMMLFCDYPEMCAKTAMCIINCVALD